MTIIENSNINEQTPMMKLMLTTAPPPTTTTTFFNTLATVTKIDHPKNGNNENSIITLMIKKHRFAEASETSCFAVAWPQGLKRAWGPAAVGFSYPIYDGCGTMHNEALLTM